MSQHDSKCAHSDATAQEIWRDVLGYEGLYQVSSLGNVRSLGRTVSHFPADAVRTVRGGPVSVRADRLGYIIADLWKNNKPKRFKVHQLVSGAFNGVRPKGLEVNHIDGNKANNTPENLEYVTRSENAIHAIRTGLRVVPNGERNGSARLTAEKVLEIRRLGASGQSKRAIARLFGVSESNVSQIIFRQIWKHI